MTRNPEELGKDRAAVVLRRALAASGRFRTIGELAAATGINASSLSGYLQGRRLPSPETWHRLAVALRPEAASAVPPTTRVPPGQPPKRASAAQDSAPKQEPIADSLQHSAAVRRAILELTRQLDFFKRGTRADREALRRTIPGRDIGYLTSLLRAIYDEDQFETWILFSQYELGGDDAEGEER
jgi:transcriptional regulator with XRE-family HTH domain